MTKSILVVDDEEPITRSLERTLRRDGYLVYTALSGQDALDIIGHHEIDMVISDMRMPQMDGYELLTQVKSLKPDAIRIILSGFTDNATIVKTVADGTARTYLTKPYSNDVLKGQIARFFMIHEKLREKKLLQKIETLKTLPALPLLYTRLKDLLKKQASIDEISQFIAQDPNYAAQILRIANSAFTGIRIGSIKQALVYLGLNTLNNVVLSIELFNGFMNKPEQKEIVENLWIHANLTSRIFQQLYQIIHEKRVPDEVSCSGLLSEIGMLLLIKNSQDYCEIIKKTVFKNEGGLALLAEEEQKLFGASHALLGAYLLNWWNLPFSLVEICMFHHYPSQVQSENGEICAMVHIASFYAWNSLMKLDLNAGFDNNVYSMIHLSEEQIKQIIERILSELHADNSKGKLTLGSFDK